MILNGEAYVGRNKKITVLPFIGKEYKLSFDISVLKPADQHWMRYFGRVINLGVNEVRAGFGYNILSLLLNTKGKLVIKSTPNGRKMRFSHTEVTPTNQWFSVEVSQKRIHNKVWMI